MSERKTNYSNLKKDLYNERNISLHNHKKYTTQLIVHSTSNVSRKASNKVALQAQKITTQAEKLTTHTKTKFGKNGNFITTEVNTTGN